MEPNALVECAYELMRGLKEELAERGTVAPAFILLHDSDCEVLTFSPRLFASAEGKAAVARAFRHRARQTGAHGALMGLDSNCFIFPTSPRCERRIHDWYRPPSVPASMR